MQIKIHPFQCELAGLDLGNIQFILDLTQLSLSRGVDSIDILPFLAVDFAGSE